MCGIAGIFDLKAHRDINRDALTRMTRALIHRGPDGEGFHIAPGIGLGHRRLAIIDREGGAQPLVAADGETVISYNGELYNYLDLGEKLRRSGVALRTRSDTEVLVEGWARCGEDFLAKTRGMYAFAIYEGAKDTLTLVRDRMGERPLYYATTEDGFLLFASEAPALMASGLLERALDPSAVADYFAYGYVPDPKSIWKGVFKLPPGALFTFRRGVPGSKPQRYWRPAFRPDETLDYDTAAAEVRARLDDAVRTQMVSDVPLGAFLSGGVDSSAVVASMAECGAGPVASCAIGFTEAKFDERAYARQVADLFDADHREQVVDLDAPALIDPVAAAYGEPFADPSALPTYRVCALARERVTVALSGDGGDEVFAGYRRYPFFLGEERARRAIPASIRTGVFGPAGKIYPKLDWAPRFLRAKTTLQSLSEDAASAYFRASAMLLPETRDALFRPDFAKTVEGYRPESLVEKVFEDADTDDPLLMAQYADYALWLPGRMLVKVDRAAMAHSLETRAPMLDFPLVEWAEHLSPEFKLKSGNGKRILKDAMRSRLPAEILDRTKRGFDAPVGAWLRAEARNPLDRLTGSSSWRDSGVLDPDAVQEMADAHKSGARNFGAELWAVIMFDAFLSASGM